MNLHSLAAWAVAIGLTSLPALAQQPEAGMIPGASQYSSQYEALSHMTPDPAKVSEVSNLLIQRDVGTIALEQGKLYLCEPVAGRVCGAVFIGQGTFMFAPPTTVEQQQLKRYFDVESLQKEFTSAFFLFTDTTLQEIAAGLALAPAEIPKNVRTQIDASMQSLFESGGYSFEFEMMKSLLEGVDNSLFAARIVPDNGDPLVLAINPFEDEQVMLLREVGMPVGQILDVVNWFYPQSVYAGESTPKRDGELLKVERYTIDCSMTDDLDFSAAVKVDYRQIKPRQKWLDLDLYPTLTIDSMQWSDGKPVQYFRKRRSRSCGFATIERQMPVDDH